MLAFTTLILMADGLAADSLYRRIASVYPNGNCLTSARIDECRNVFAQQSIDLFVTTIGVADGDVLDLLLEQNEAARAPRRTLIISSCRLATRVLNSLNTLGIHGAFDSGSEPPAQIEPALRAIEAGAGYWSPTHMQSALDPAARARMRQLSPTEQLVLAVVGRGFTDIAASDALGMRPSAVQTVRRELYAKLGIHDKGDLIQVAASLGFVRFTAQRVESVGLGLLIKEYKANARRPMKPPLKRLAA